MRIVIDARCRPGVMSGLARYARNLVGELSRLDSENEYFIIRNSCFEGRLAQQENFTEVQADYDIATLRHCLLGHRLIERLRPDIYHSLFHFLPQGLRCQRILLTLHDFIWYRSPWLAFRDPVRAGAVYGFARIFMPRALRLADQIIAVSSAVEKEAVNRFPELAGRVRVIWHGVNPIFRFEPKGGGGYVLAVGNSKPYKNYSRLVRAFALVGRQFPWLRLIVVGRADYRTSLEKEARQAGVGGRMELTGSIPDRALVNLLQRAEFLAIPSLEEGFGLPIAEALTVGCPVLTSNRPPMSDIAGDAAVLVEPRSVESIAEGMRRLLTEPQLRSQLIQRGRERSRLFSVRHCAEETLTLYGSAHRSLRPERQGLS